MTADDGQSSAQAHERAQRILVGGVNSPVRAFRAVGGTPRTVARAEGARIWDIDGRAYIDLVGSWGPAIVGHAHPTVIRAIRDAAGRGLTFGAPCEAETLLAERIASAIPSIEKVRFVNSGSEAGMAAIRLARAATSRDLIIKFAGCYHGHADSMLVAAGSGASTLGTPDSAGVTTHAASQTLTATYNDLPSVQRLLDAHAGAVAAVFVEPIAGNMGMVMPDPGFLAGLRDLCDQTGALLVFDEVMTGFRVCWGGWQVACGVRPDLTMLAKVIGGGMPVGALAGPARLMDLLAPLGPVYQAGTLSGNPTGMAAGLATLDLCATHDFYPRLHESASRLAQGVADAAGRHDFSISAAAQGGMVGVAFAPRTIRDYDDAKAADHGLFARFFHAMLERGVWLPPSGYESWFVSSAHTPADIDTIIDGARDAFAELAR